MMATSPFSDEEIWNNWIESPSVRRFESGLCTPREFADDIIAEYRLTISADEFLAEWSRWPRGPYQGAVELLENLRLDFRIACLSNTNQAHWEEVLQHLHLMSLFDQKFMSHETGRLKPDEESFQNAIDRLGSKPQEILFFDDNPANVKGARDAGMQAELVQKPGGVINKLNSLGISI